MQGGDKKARVNVGMGTRLGMVRQEVVEEEKEVVVWSAAPVAIHFGEYFLPAILFLLAWLDGGQRRVPAFKDVVGKRKEDPT